MDKFFRKAVIASAAALAFGGTAFAADVTMTNGSISASINDAGNFSSASDPLGSAPPIGSPGLSYMGNEFINLGSPSSWYWLTAGGTDYTSWYAGSPYNPLGASTVVTAPDLITTTFSTGSLSFVQTATLSSSNVLSISVSIHNGGTTALTGVTYSVGFDPDQGVPIYGDFTTANAITGSGTGASVDAAFAALGADGKVRLQNTTSASAFSIAAYVSTGSCCLPVAPSTILGAGQAVGFSATGDYGIGLGYDLGSLAAGGTAVIGYDYIFAPVPEPETYAMLLAGLGLMGFVARRRQRKLAAA